MRGGFLGVLSFYNIMAEGKKSFVAYSDWYGMFKALPDEVAGKLIKHIFSYVNDENPTTEDFIINALFEQVKSTLKRDLKKWEEQQEQRKKAGIRSAEVRKQNATLVNARLISSTDNVNVNVNDNVINKIESKPSLETRSHAFKETLRPFLNQYGSDMLKTFYNYWSEPNQSKTKMKFELEKTWETSRRLATWSKREKDFTKKEDKPKTLGI
jgi:hypothetical protein